MCWAIGPVPSLGGAGRAGEVEAVGERPPAVGAGAAVAVPGVSMGDGLPLAVAVGVGAPAGVVVAVGVAVAGDLTGLEVHDEGVSVAVGAVVVEEDPVSAVD